LSQRFQKFSDTVCIGVFRSARNWPRHLRWKWRSSLCIAGSPAAFSRGPGQDLKENRDRDEQQKKQIIEMERRHFLLS